VGRHGSNSEICYHNEGQGSRETRGLFFYAQIWGLIGDYIEIYNFQIPVDLGFSEVHQSINNLVMKFFFSEDVCEEFGYNFAAAPT